MMKASFILLLCKFCCVQSTLEEVFSWKQVSYNLDGVVYKRDSDYKKVTNGIHFQQDLEDWEKYFIQYNNVPIGFEVYGERVFITVPRWRYGIPSTLNYVDISSKKSPHLKRYPGSENLTSVYRPRVDICGRLWMVDTGLLEIPGNRTQVKPPAIVVFDLKTDRQILYYKLTSAGTFTEKTAGGLTSVTVNVGKNGCEDTHAYINDLATGRIIGYSLKNQKCFSLMNATVVHKEKALNFTAAGYLINWKDGLFSITLSDIEEDGYRTAYYHSLASLDEYAINTKYLTFPPKTHSYKTTNLGSKGSRTQSGSHDYHSPSKTIFFANVAQDAILCWRVTDKMTPSNVKVALQDHEKLVYISDLKVKGDYVWVLVNKMPIFLYSKFNLNEDNFFLHRIKIEDLSDACG